MTLPGDMPLRGLPLAVLDTETTGVDPAEDRVVEVAVVHATLGNEDVAPVLAFHSLVHPGRPIPPGASRIHGILDAAVAEAPPWAEVSSAVTRACEGRVVVAYNAPYDFSIVHAENERIPLAGPGWPWLDLLVVRKALRPRQRPGTLVEVTAEHGLILEAHGAAGDALATAWLATPLCRALWATILGPRALGPPTWSTLRDWQRGAATQQERGYADWCRRQGHAHPPRCDWHRLEGLAPPGWTPPRPRATCSCGAQVVRRVQKDGSLLVLDEDGVTPHQHPGPG